MILPPIAIGIGIGILVWMAQGRDAPTQTEHGETACPVRVIEALAVELAPSAEGYGPVRPARVWKAVAQVSGRIIEIHPRLRDGEILAAGTELIRIDPIDYELALAQAQAELAKLEVPEQNARASLEIEERNRDLANQERSGCASSGHAAPSPTATWTRPSAPRCPGTARCRTCATP